MAYENQGQPFVQQPVATRTKSGMSKWWFISFFIAAIVLFIIGGGLVGAWISSATSYVSDYDTYDNYDTYDYTYNNGEYYGAVACFALGGICKLVAWILLIVWCVQRRRTRTIVVQQAYEPYQSQGWGGNNYGAPAPRQGAYAPVPSPAPAPPYGNAQAPPNEGGMPPMRYCNNCGAAVTTPYCAQCGIKG
jgi:hypothetical protein